jgi:hypothetical protein
MAGDGKRQEEESGKQVAANRKTHMELLQVQRARCAPPEIFIGTVYPFSTVFSRIPDE